MIVKSLKKHRDVIQDASRECGFSACVNAGFAGIRSRHATRTFLTSLVLAVD